MTEIQLPQRYRVVEYDNQEIVVSKYPFIHEECGRPELATMREKYELDKVVASAKTEFERQAALRCWVRKQFPHGKKPARERVPNIRSNCLRILEYAEKGGSFICPIFATLYIEVCLAMGYPARFLEISKPECEIIAPDVGNVGHCVAEVWSNQYGKWILMDPDSNWHYELEGVPLSALEVHDAWLNGREKDTVPVQGDPPFYTDDEWEKEYPGIMEPYFAHQMMDYYHYVRVTLRNDYLSNPLPYGFPSRSEFNPQLHWTDSQTPPMYVYASHPMTGSHYTNLRHDFEWTLNQTHIELEAQGEKDAQVSSLVKVMLETATPWFSHFEASIDDGEWQRSPSRFEWRLHPGINRICARSVNLYGIVGRESKIAIDYQP